MKFNLVSEPWIRIQTLSGERGMRGLKPILLGAHEIVRLEDESPFVLGGLHRLLLAVLHRALCGPEGFRSARELLAAGRFPDEVADYLDQWEHRFDLFDDVAPFWQAGWFPLDASDRSPVTMLAVQHTTGNNKVLFDHSWDDSPPALTPSEVARWLVGAQSFAISSGKGKAGFPHTKDGPIGAAALVVPVGRTLFQTLCFNLVSYPKETAAMDAPIWEAAAPTLEEIQRRPERKPKGITDLYTWHSRTVRLHPEMIDGDVRVRWVSITSGIFASEREADDPMVAYRSDEKKGLLPRRYGQDRGFWRDFQALLPPLEGKGDHPPLALRHAEEIAEPGAEPRVMVIGQGRDQSKVTLWRLETYPLPPTLFSEDALAREVLAECLELAENAGKGMRGVIAALTGDLDEARRVMDREPLQRNFWSGMEEEFPSLLAALAVIEDDGSRAKEEWKEKIRSCAWRAFAPIARAYSRSGEEMRAAIRAERKLRRELHDLLGERKEESA